MLEEILEQPAAIARTVAALRTLSPELDRLGADRRRVLFAGRGSSDNAATYGRYLVETVGHRPSGSLAPSVATAYRPPLDLRDALVVVISQSGETTELVETLQWARRCGAATVALTNASDSALARASDLAMVTRAGPELAVPATKTFSTQLAALAVLTESLAPGSLPDLDRVPDEVAAVLESRGAVSGAVAALVARSRTVIASRGLSQVVAAEVALKIQETCLRPVLGMSYADLRHGPIAVVDDRTTAVVVAPPDGPLRRGILGLVPELRSRGALVVGIGAGDDVDVAVPGPRLREPLAPIGLVAAGQLLVEGMARGLGLDPDGPRGLTKVTQTDPEGAA